MASCRTDHARTDAANRLSGGLAHAQLCHTGARLDLVGGAQAIGPMLLVLGAQALGTTLTLAVTGLPLSACTGVVQRALKRR